MDAPWGIDTQDSSIALRGRLEVALTPLAYSILLSRNSNRPNNRVTHAGHDGCTGVTTSQKTVLTYITVRVPEYSVQVDRMESKVLVVPVYHTNTPVAATVDTE